MIKDLSKHIYAVFAILFSSSISGASTNGLVTTGWLRANCEKENIRIVDLRRSQEFIKDHIPGAVPFVTESLRTSDNTLKSRSELLKLIGKIGISNTTTVVVYSDGQDWRPFYFLWVLEYLGHSTITVLEGGYEKWVSEHRPVTKKTTSSVPQKYCENKKIRDELYTNEKLIMSDLKSTQGILICVDSQTQRQSLTKDNIVFWSISKDISSNGLWKEFIELKKDYEEAGVTSEKSICVVSADGGLSSIVYYSLRHLLGYKNVKLYDGKLTSLASFLPVTPDSNLHTSTW